MEQLDKIMTKEYLAKLEALSLTVKNRYWNGSAGMRKSMAKGSSLEFSDYRDYTMGDDLRRIDWNGYARFERLFLKLFMEEKQASIHFFLDSSKSMGFGEKFSFAKAMVASLAYISLKETDKVSVFSCSDKILDTKKNVQSPNAFIDVVRFLDNLQCLGGSSLLQCVKESRKKKLSQGVSFLFSDLFMNSASDWQEAIKLLQYAKQEIILVWILSQEEVKPKERGSIRLLDAETGESRDIDLTPQIVTQYEKVLHQYELEIKEFCKKRGITIVKLLENTPLLQGINAVL